MVPLVRLDLAREDLQQGGLAGAVLAQQAVHLARANVEVRAPQGVDTAVSLVDSVGTEDLGR